MIYCCIILYALFFTIPTLGQTLNLSSAVLPTDLSNVSPISKKATQNSQGLIPEQSSLPLFKKNEPVKIGIVIDDLGSSWGRTKLFTEFSGVLTLSFLPSSSRLIEQVALALTAGHEVIAHIPMEPIGTDNPGQGALMAHHSSDNITYYLAKYLDNLSGYTGANNHMGSKFTSNRKAMYSLMIELKARNLFWLDSMTHFSSIGNKIAGEVGVLNIARDIFIDNVVEQDMILQQLEVLERIALKKGYAVGIGHPNAITYKILSEWYSRLDIRKIELVSISEIITKK